MQVESWAHTQYMGWTDLRNSLNCDCPYAQAVEFRDPSGTLATPSTVLNTWVQVRTPA